MLPSRLDFYTFSDAASNVEDFVFCHACILHHVQVFLSMMVLNRTFVLSDVSITQLSSFDCSLDAAGLVEASLSEAPLTDSAATEEDKDQTALAKPVSVLAVSEHSDVEK